MEERIIVAMGDMSDPQFANTTKLLEEAEVGKIVVVGAGRQSFNTRLLLADPLSKVIDLDILGKYNHCIQELQIDKPDSPLVSGKMLALLSRGVPMLKKQ